jgi:hypothetical protein
MIVTFDSFLVSTAARVDKKIKGLQVICQHGKAASNAKGDVLCCCHGHYSTSCAGQRMKNGVTHGCCSVKREEIKLRKKTDKGLCEQILTVGRLYGRDHRIQLDRECGAQIT